MGDERSSIYLVADRDGDADTAAMHLSRIGIDNVDGALSGGFGAWRKSGRPIETSGVITPRELAGQRESLQVLGVREDDEFDGGRCTAARYGSAI